MNEIEKLYQNAKIKKQYCGWLDMGDLDCQMQYVRCNSINEYKEAVFSSRFGETEEEPELKYPEFTAEKQLELLKICFDKYERLEKVRGLKERCIIYHHFESNGYSEFVNCETWEETIAGLINTLWQSLTEEERNQIKEILK